MSLKPCSIVASQRNDGLDPESLLKVARASADMTGSDTIEAQHVADAVPYRRFAKE
ncbi:MAG: hypothetical protein H6942_02715 [Candidatus Accumulibacter sp.]|uniref:magnesium chelatase subunit ChlI family protein n=1 Tax=Accumulibacter sp. TaxID=2053492 RepID=UPI0019F76FEA|nr:hypothetical protein [Paracoccaceae bacterium]MCB1943683.1 hypothetical protein [Accumulibacter sp.]MCP5247447.1 hypothetical protein [Accumulibacter sp.]